jgi:hypothetical protein
MWKKANANPAGKLVDDCVVRAISIATNQPWLKVYDDIYLTGRAEFDMPNSNEVDSFPYLYNGIADLSKWKPGADLQDLLDSVTWN